VSHLLPVAAGMSPETLRGHTLKIGERLRAASAVNQVAVVPRSITVTTDSTFIRSHDDRERHLEVRVGNVETGEGGRQVFGAVLRLASERGLDVDLHVDESGDPAATALAHVAAAVLRNRFRGRVVCGHCCSLAVQPEEQIRRTLDLCAEAGIAIVTLPTVNLYLQDRSDGRTPRWRGVAPVHEMRHRGIPVAIAGDNCRDPFHAYGDHDMVDTFRQAVRILHLDHPFGDAAAMVGPVPQAIIRAGLLGTIVKGGAARLILFNARTLNELMCRPQSDRLVIDRGRQVSAELPDYCELDGVG
jgi:cytosine/creatinine deaminase